MDGEFQFQETEITPEPGSFRVDIIKVELEDDEDEPIQQYELEEEMSDQKYLEGQGQQLVEEQKLQLSEEQQELFKEVKQQLSEEEQQLNEVQEKYQQETYENFDLQLRSPELEFSEAEVTRDIATGLPICMLCFETLGLETITQHMVTVHKYRKIFFKCWNCEEIFKEKNRLNIHKQQCLPQKSIKKIPTMKQYIKEATEKYDSKNCPICLIEINTTDSMAAHLETEHQVQGTQPIFSCPVCHDLFKSKNSLNQHKKFVHVSKQEPIPCSECDKKFAAPNLLANHVRNVHPNDGRIHRCEECGKDYKSHQSLYQHIKYVHEQAKPKRRKPQKRKPAATQAQEAQDSNQDSD